MHNFKFGVECSSYVIRVLGVIPSNEVEIINKNTFTFGDVEVTFKSNLTIDQIRKYMSQVEDGHVMYQTVALESEYSGYRNLDITF